MMQPDGYAAHDKEFKAEGQGGASAVAYLTQFHPDDILDYKLTNIEHEGGNPTYIIEKGGINDAIRDNGERALEEEPAESDERA